MKRRLCLLIGACFLIGSLFAQESWTPEDMIDFKRIGKIAISPRGDQIIYEVWSDVVSDTESRTKSDLFLYEYGENKALATGDFSYENPVWSPSGEYVLFSSERNGEPFLWLQTMQTNRGRILAELPNTPSQIKFSPDGKWVSYIGNKLETEEQKRIRIAGEDAMSPGDHTSRHIWIVNLSTSEVWQLTEGEFSVGARNGNLYDWSPDSKEIVFAHQPSSLYNDWQQTDLSIVKISSGKITSLGNTVEAEAEPYFSPDGQWIGFRANDSPQEWIPRSRAYIMRPDGTDKKPLAKTVDESFSLIGWAPDGFSLLAEEAFRTSHRLVSIPTSGRNPVYYEADSRLMGKPYLSPDRNWVGFTLEAPNQPEELYLTRLNNFKPEKVSDIQPELTKQFGESEVIEWTSSDGVSIEGILTYPIDHQAGEAVPLLVMPHGGPASVSKNGFLGNKSPYSLALFSAAGYAVLRPNFRGSKGYGVEFRGANKGDLGGMDYEDVMSGVDYLIEKGIADPERLGIIGWSYGGYMTTWAISQTDRFKVAIDGAGVTNLISFTALTDMPDYIVGYLGGETWEIRDLMIERSPLFQLASIQTPTLILHGEEDVRVPISQSQELYIGLKRKGIPVEFYAYPRQGHGLREPKHVLHAMETVMAWLGKWLQN